MAKGFNARPSASGGNMMSQLAKLQEQMAQAQEDRQHDRNRNFRRRRGFGHNDR